MTILYGAMVSVMFVCAVWLSNISPQMHFGLKKWLAVFLFITSPLIFSNNALSHDVFNYIFNARMVVKYQLNPHVRVAMDLLYDPWTRFMHNVHTPAPYFYGWTALSLIPYILGFGKFLITYILFRIWSELGLLLSAVLIWFLMKKQSNQNVRSFVLMLLNPLLIIELVSNSHNDGWMMWPALASLYFILAWKMHRKQIVLRMTGSFSLLLFSISTKYATAVLAPIWLFVVLKNSEFADKLQALTEKLKVLSFNIFDVSAMLLFLPLLTARSQQFNPWYLSWSLLFYPLMKNKFLKYSVLILSVSSLFRYIPWMWYGAFDYNSQIDMNQKLITWVPLFSFCLIWLSYTVSKTLKKAYTS
ncbi:MAG: hypothetical protein ABI425_01055 [Patescibacteria group bacterium]